MASHRRRAKGSDKVNKEKGMENNSYFQRRQKKINNVSENLRRHEEMPTRGVVSLPPTTPAIKLIPGMFSSRRVEHLYFRTFPRLATKFSTSSHP